MSRGHVLVSILTVIRDNPGLRPSELFKLLEEYRVGPFWLKTCERNGYIVDTGATARKLAWNEYRARCPEPTSGPPEVRAWLQTYFALAGTDGHDAWYAANPMPEHAPPTEEEMDNAEKEYKTWVHAGPERIHPAIYITERGLKRIDGPLPVHPRRRYEFEFFENELKQVDAVLNALNNNQPVGSQCYRYAKTLHEEQVEDSNSPLYVVKMKLNAEAFEAIRVLEHQLHGGGFSLE